MADRKLVQKQPLTCKRIVANLDIEDQLATGKIQLVPAPIFTRYYAHTLAPVRIITRYYAHNTHTNANAFQLVTQLLFMETHAYERRCENAS